MNTGSTSTPVRRAALPAPVQRWLARHGVGHPGASPDVEAVTPSVKGVRRRRPKDLAACSRLLGLVSATGEYPVPRPDSLRGWLSDETVLDAWVAERDGELLGHIALTRVGYGVASTLRWREITGRPTSDLAEVSQFFVRPRVRAQGIGKGLYSAAVAEARARGLVPVAQGVSTGRDGIEFYEDRGWRLVAMYPWGDRSKGLEAYLYVLPPDAPA